MRISPVTNIKPAPTLPVTRPGHVTCQYTPPRAQKTAISPAHSLERLTIQHPRHHYSPKGWESFLDPVDQRVGYPPVRIGQRWPDYQGARNWEGLLNPLDDSLRSEILRYGYFVEAAYRSFDFDPSSGSYATCRYSKRDLLERAGFPDTGYKVTKNLRATSGIQMPRWTEKAASWATMQSSWIGYVAVCTDKEEIQRLGRRDVVIALRGTATCHEWLENLRATLTELPGATDTAMVESGFLSLYTSETATCPSLQEMVRSEVERILETYKGEEVSFTITGHSLGAALATLAAYDIKTTFKEAAGHVAVISFGGPRVGNKSFRCHVENQGTKILRVVNPNDLITKLPGFVIGQQEENEEEEDDNENENERGIMEGWGMTMGMGWATTSTEWLQKRVEESSTQWGYAEVGRELRVTEEAPWTKMNMNWAKCHDLKTYLSLVGSHVRTPNCPLRETAKRFLRT